MSYIAFMQAFEDSKQSASGNSITPPIGTVQTARSVDVNCGQVRDDTALATHMAYKRYNPRMPSSKKIDLDKVLASLNTVCPECKAEIEPAQIVRVSFDEIKCPWCDAIFQPRKTA